MVRISCQVNTVSLRSLVDDFHEAFLRDITSMVHTYFHFPWLSSESLHLEEILTSSVLSSSASSEEFNKTFQCPHYISDATSHLTGPEIPV
jgi:hypothetical protein